VSGSTFGSWDTGRHRITPSTVAELTDALDHPLDRPDDPTGPISIRLVDEAPNFEQAKSVWSRPDRR
jgi:hypothetical protein